MSSFHPCKEQLWKFHLCKERLWTFHPCKERLWNFHPCKERLWKGLQNDWTNERESPGWYLVVTTSRLLMKLRFEGYISCNVQPNKPLASEHRDSQEPCMVMMRFHFDVHHLWKLNHDMLHAHITFCHDTGNHGWIEWHTWFTILVQHVWLIDHWRKCDGLGKSYLNPKVSLVIK